jgi:hypothetical protein
MAENDGLTVAPVLIIDLDVPGIFLSDENVSHKDPPGA